jgi:hypothetical protein
MTEFTLFFMMTLKLKSNLLGFGNLFHRINLVTLFVFDLPDTAETSWSNLVDEVVAVPAQLLLLFLHYCRGWKRRTFLCAEEAGVKVLLCALLGWLQLNYLVGLWRIDGWPYFLRYFWTLFGIEKISFVHVDIGAQFGNVTVKDVFKAYGWIGCGYFLDAFAVTGRFLGISMHLILIIEKKVYRNYKQFK